MRPTPGSLAIALAAALAASAATTPAAAQDAARAVERTDSTTAAGTAAAPRPHFEVEGYGTVNYAAYRWQTDPKRRDAIDLERLVVEPSYVVNDRLRFDADIEFEHGGTGATLEFDPFEEFGEYEQEIEQGGEIVVEKLQVTYRVSSALGLRAGRMYVPVGMITAAEAPDAYFTPYRNEAESAILPNIWYETGVGAFGRVGSVAWTAVLVSGLDATGFSSANWIQRGHQTRFETVNANGLAVAARLDWSPFAGLTAGVSGYYGNSASNRPKADLTVPANVGIADAHLRLERGPVAVRALLLYGHLQNAAAVSAANRNLSNALGVKRTPVGSAALGWFVEAGYDLLPLLRGARAGDASLTVFGRYDWYDTMYRVEGDIFDNPRWERHAVTAGLNWRPDPHLVVKGALSRRAVGLATANREDTASLGLALLFGD